MTHLKTSQGFFMRLFAGEPLHDTIARFCEEHGITAGHFTAIGAVRELELAYYHLDRKQYATRLFPSDLEVVSCTGNVALLDGHPFLHVRVVEDVRTAIEAHHEYISLPKLTVADLVY